jgi:hypothetical protein
MEGSSLSRRPRIDLPKPASRLSYFARRIANAMMDARGDCLLWIQESKIWDANLHLYYRVREGYGDRALLEEAPGHLFLGFEVTELTTFLHLALLNGWGGWMLTEHNYLTAWFSHDEYLDLYHSDGAEAAASELYSSLTS